MQTKSLMILCQLYAQRHAYRHSIVNHNDIELLHSYLETKQEFNLILIQCN